MSADVGFFGGNAIGEQLTHNYAEYHASVPAEELRALRLRQDFPAMLGELGLGGGEFVLYPTVDADDGECPSTGDHWRGAYVENGEVRDMQLHANAAGWFSTKVAQHRGRTVYAALDARIFFPQSGE